MTHSASEPCPFNGDHNPSGVFGSCCSFRAKGVAMYLMALGLTTLSILIHRDSSPQEAIEFAGKLREAVKELRDISTAAGRETGVPGNPDMNEYTVEVADVSWRFPIETALKEIEAVADWYEKIGRMHFGVHAWF